MWRRDVFELAEDWRAGRVSSRALLVAVCMWGTSLRDYGPSRTRAVLEVDVNGAKLDHNLEPSDHWVAYLRWATAQASNPLFGGEPDAVEMALFNGAWPQNS